MNAYGFQCIVRFLERMFLLRATTRQKNEGTVQQECIPVGWVPPASMVISGSWGCLPRGSLPGRVRPPDREADTPWTQRQTPPLPHCMLGYTHPWPMHADIHSPPGNRMTDRCKNHYLPATSFVDGKIIGIFEKLAKIRDPSLNARAEGNRVAMILCWYMDSNLFGPLTSPAVLQLLFCRKRLAGFVGESEQSIPCGKWSTQNGIHPSLNSRLNITRHPKNESKWNFI